MRTKVTEVSIYPRAKLDERKKYLGHSNLILTLEALRGDYRCYCLPSTEESYGPIAQLIHKIVQSSVYT